MYFIIFLIAVSFFIPTQLVSQTDLLQQKLSQYITIYKDAPYFEWIKYRLKVEIIPILFQVQLTAIPVLGLFLLGLYFGKQKLYLSNKTNYVHLKTICRWSFFISLPILLANGLVLLWRSLSYGKFSPLKKK